MRERGVDGAHGGDRRARRRAPRARRRGRRAGRDPAPDRARPRPSRAAAAAPAPVRRRRSRAARSSARAVPRHGARASSRATAGLPCRAPCAATGRPPRGFPRRPSSAGYCRRMRLTDLPGGAARRDDMGVSHAADGTAALASEDAARSERTLIQAAQRGDPGAIEDLYRRHWKPAYRAAYLVTRDAHAAEDIAQEAFLQAIRVLDRFDRGRPFAPWLHRIVTNRALDWARAHALRRPSRPRASRSPRMRAAISPTTSPRRSAGWRPISAPSSCCATCSSTRRARSQRCSTCRAAPSTRACAGHWTSSQGRWTHERRRAAAEGAPAAASRPRARSRPASAAAGSCSPPMPSARRRAGGACGCRD